MHKTFCVLSALVIATPLAAQQQAGKMAGMDMTNTVKGSGKLPDGWKLRYDPQATDQRRRSTAVNVVTMGSGHALHLGPGRDLLQREGHGLGPVPGQRTFSQRKSMAHEAYGIFIGGNDLQTASRLTRTS